MTAHDYVICAKHRCGSSLLCAQLRATGVAGTPREHIQRLGLPGWVPFHPVRDRDIIALLPPRSGRRDRPRPEALIAQARAEGAGPDGVCGTKVMWRNLAGLAQMLGRSPEGVIRELTPGLRCVHITRRDRVAQAVSYWTAWQTGAWSAAQPEQREPVYHRRAVSVLVEFFADQDRQWRELFDRAGIDAHTVTYEDLVADPVATVRDVLRYIGARDDVPVPQSAMRQQRSDRSAAWVARYLAEQAG